MRAARDAATVEVVSHPAPARVATIADLLAIPEAERRHEIIDGALAFRCGWKHTNCLARGICLPDECAPAPKAEPLPATCCTPGSKCC